MMRRLRTTPKRFFRRTRLPLIAGLLAAAIVVPGGGAEVRSESESAAKVPKLVFPLIAKTALWDNYGDPRGNRSHAGIDMPSARRDPLVATEAGRVEYATSNLGGCMLYLYGRSGTMYLYIHLNNDLTEGNDNRGRCVKGIAYAVRDGASVAAGEQVGFNGDSGDQDGNPGLHFEVHPSGGADVNPFPHLKKASKLLFAGRQGAAFSLGLRGRLLAAGDNGLRLSATHVRSYPGGRWLEIDERPLDLAYALDDASGIVRQRISAKVSTKVTVFTAKAEVTKEALAGAPGALAVTRVTPLAP